MKLIMLSQQRAVGRNKEGVVSSQMPKNCSQCLLHPQNLKMSGDHGANSTAKGQLYIESQYIYSHRSQPVTCPIGQFPSLGVPVNK